MRKKSVVSRIVTDDDFKFYTVEEVCEILKVSSQTVRKLIKNEQLFAIKLGREYRIPKYALTQLCKNGLK